MVCSHRAGKIVGFTKVVHRAILHLGWNWENPTFLRGPNNLQVNLSRLSLKTARGERERHALRDGLRGWWWRRGDIGTAQEQSMTLGQRESGPRGLKFWCQPKGLSSSFEGHEGRDSHVWPCMTVLPPAIVMLASWLMFCGAATGCGMLD